MERGERRIQLMSNHEFANAFRRLSALFAGADDLIHDYNLLLIYLQQNPPKDASSSPAWQEVKDLKPFMINAVN